VPPNNPLAPDGALSAAQARLEAALRARFARTAPQVKRVFDRQAEVREGKR